MLKIFQNVFKTGCVTENVGGADGVFSSDFTNLVRLDEAVCSGCSQKACFDACPTGAIKKGAGGKLEVSSFRCIECRMCEDSCPRGAVTFKKFGAGSAVIAAAQEKLAEEVRKNFSGSFHIRQLDVGSCNGCEHEMISACNPVFDLSRFGIDFVASPRHADCLLVTGPVTWNLREALVRTYEATPSPKVVVAMGTCSISGAPFPANYANYGGIGKMVPVDVYIPGCPPHPYALIAGLLNVIGHAASRK